jgi:hypothetical protein
MRERDLPVPRRHPAGHQRDAHAGRDAPGLAQRRDALGRHVHRIEMGQI